MGSQTGTPRVGKQSLTGKSKTSKVRKKKPTTRKASKGGMRKLVNLRKGVQSASRNLRKGKKTRRKQKRVPGSVSPRLDRPLSVLTAEMVWTPNGFSFTESEIDLLDLESESERDVLKVTANEFGAEPLDSICEEPATEAQIESINGRSIQIPYDESSASQHSSKRELVSL